MYEGRLNMVAIRKIMDVRGMRNADLAKRLNISLLSHGRSYSLLWFSIVSQRFFQTRPAPLKAPALRAIDGEHRRYFFQRLRDSTDAARD